MKIVAMMKLNRYFLLILPLAVLLSSCSKEEGGDSPEEDPEAILSAIPGVKTKMDAPTVITHLSFKAAEDPSKMVLGVFEGATQPDFSDAVPIYIIKEKPSSGINQVDITCSKGFKYLRYYGRSGHRTEISDIKYEGYPSDGDYSSMLQMTNLPFLVVHTKSHAEVLSKDWYTLGNVFVITDGGKSCKLHSMKIKGRGNASWDMPKKPYRIKLDDGAHFAGLKAKARDWVLINAYGDKTMLRNILSFEVSKALNMAFTPTGIMVELLLNGEYMGTYTLCDQVEIHEDRVAITKMKPTETSAVEVTGGYLMDFDCYSTDGVGYFYTNNGTHVRIREPDDKDINANQNSYIQNYIKTFEDQILNPSAGYDDILDVDSFLRYFLLGEMTGNTDTFYCTKVYKERNDPKLHIGPGWDFDLTFDNDNRTHPINSYSGYLAFSYGSSYAAQVRKWAQRVVSDNGGRIKEIWKEARTQGGLTSDNLLSFIDYWAAEVDESQKLNYTRWKILSSKVHMNFQALGSYEAEVEYLKKVVEERVAWMDKVVGITVDE